MSVTGEPAYTHDFTTGPVLDETWVVHLWSQTQRSERQTLHPENVLLPVQGHGWIEARRSPNIPKS
jgi:hypothetical protein